MQSQSLLLVLLMGAAVEAPAQTATPAAPPQKKTDVGTIVRMISVVDDESKGVEAEIHLNGPNGSSVVFAKTNASGIATPNATCLPTHKLVTKPRMDDLYLPGPTKSCAGTLRIVLPKIALAYLLKRRGEYALQNDPQLAAMLLLEANSRLARKDPQAAKDAHIKGLEAVARALDIKGQAYIFDTDQDAAVLTAIGKARVVQFQVKAGVQPANGELNYATLKALSGGRDVGPYIRHANYATEQGKN